MALGMEVGLGPGHVVIDGDPAPPPQKGGRAPDFWRISIVAKWLDASSRIALYRTVSASSCLYMPTFMYVI